MLVDQRYILHLRDLGRNVEKAVVVEKCLVSKRLRTLIVRHTQ